MNKQNINNKTTIFGTDGIRGKVGEGYLTPGFVQEVGRAIGRVFGSKKTDNNSILIARDTRISGDMIQAALSSGICSTGISITDIGIASTPECAYLTKKLGAKAGIVISASHNPYYDNGIKIFNSNGGKLSDDEEFSIENVLFANQASNNNLISPNRIGQILVNNDYSKHYIDYCIDLFNRCVDKNNTSNKKISNSNIKVLLDCSNGSSYKSAPEVLAKLGFNLIVVNNNPNGFNINQDCGAACRVGLNNLSKLVKKHKADLAISFDGDGDRILLIDGNGNTIDGDQIIYILACEQLRLNSDLRGVVGTLMSNLGLELALKAKGLGFERAKVGDRYVFAKLLEKDWKLGGETSGHILSLDHASTGDGLVTALLILSVMLNTGLSLQELVNDFQKYPQIMVNVNLSGYVTNIDGTNNIEHQSKIEDILELPEVVLAIKKAKDTLDGYGRVLVRKSGTEPLIRVMVEGENARNIERIANSIADIIKQQLVK